MRKASSPAEALEAVPFLTLLLVPLIPHVLGANIIDREGTLEMPESCGNVALVDGETAAYESAVMRRMRGDVPEALTRIRVVRRTEMPDTRLLLGFPELFRDCFFGLGLAPQISKDVIPPPADSRLHVAMGVDPARMVGEGVAGIIRGLVEDGGGG